MSFVENLSHTLRFTYYSGTNDSNVPGMFAPGTAPVALSGETVYMTDDDNAWEINFDTQYKIYENLTTYLELGYINLDMDSDVWGDNYLDDNAWRAQIGFVYKF